jgi:hypothetical protein
MKEQYLVKNTKGLIIQRLLTNEFFYPIAMELARVESANTNLRYVFLPLNQILKFKIKT